MFFKMLIRALARQKRKHLMIAFTVGLGVSLATAMLGVMFDVGDKVNQELKSYGANLSVVPKGASMLGDLYQSREIDSGADGKANGQVDGRADGRASGRADGKANGRASGRADGKANGRVSGRADDGTISLDDNDYLPEDQLYKIKMIFWAYNIVDFAPYLTVEVQAGDQTVPLTGTWFNRTINLPTGESVTTGMMALKSWWTLNGAPGDDGAPLKALVGSELAKRQNLAPGSRLSVKGPNGLSRELTVAGVFHSGGEEDNGIVSTLALAQELADRPGLVQRVEVSALTTPENELARRAALNPGSLSRVEWDTWYCTAYISSIAYQIEEILPMVRVKPILRVAQSEGAILEKTQLMIVILTILTLLCSALAISNLVTANVMERSVEIGLMKALGASGLAITALVLAEILVASCFGGLAGYLVGLGLAQLIGLTVFGSWVAVKLAVIPIGALMVLAVSLAGSLPALRALLRLKPTEVLHGR
ncbi:MAG: ABC transporter permease [Deltaproteobacteria bacterium]|nr:ABC transporter permease [Deltaproteobacteria bacterium]